jgi:ABC-type branched-subunit amino acid transport system substrate-binding protein
VRVALAAAPGRRFRRTAGAVLVLAAVAAAPCAATEPAPVPALPAHTVPVPGTRDPSPAPAAAEDAIRPHAPPGVPVGPLWEAESAYQAGRHGEALPRFLDLAYSFPDDERKGFVWMRVGDLLLARGELHPALEAADKAISLSRAPFLVLSAMELKYRVCLALRRMDEARAIAASLLERGYVLAEPFELLTVMARADMAGGNVPRALAEFRQAAAAARTPEEAAAVREERDILIEALSSIPVLRDAAEAEEEPEARGLLYLVFGRVAAAKGFVGMAAYALGRAAQTGGSPGEEARRQLSRLEAAFGSRPKIVGLVPLSGRHADIGFSVLSGAEVALRQAVGETPESFVPVLVWRDTGAEPGRARREFGLAALDGTVAGFLGPLTGEEGHSVSAAFNDRSPPVLYLGQKTIPEKPFLYGFGLTPLQEARAVLGHLARRGISNLLLLHPENGYGRGFSEAVAAAARETGVAVAKTVAYDPGTNDFTEVIRRAVGSRAFSAHSATREKGKAMALPMGGAVIADRWDRVFLLASQLRYYNVYLPLAGFSGWSGGDLLRRAGDAVQDAVFSVDYSAAVPGIQGERFRSAFRDAFGVAPSGYEAVGFDGATLFSEAYRLESWKNVDRPAGEAVREWVPTLRTFRGVTGLFRFGPSGEMHRDVHLMRVDSGRLVPAGG